MGKIIYVIEDDSDIREFIEYMLLSEKFKVVVCATAQIFWENLKIALPDLVIMDIMLPDGNGIDISNQLKENVLTQHIPILHMSANIYNKTVFSESASRAFISKPFNNKDFLLRVQELLN